jgi:RND family efflux transporter MFP subunit
MTKTLAANGSMAAWQEASVSAEVGGSRLVQILVQVGDSVKKGQVLAKFSTANAQIEVETAKALALEAEALATEAVANAERARGIEKEGFYSPAQLGQIYSNEKAAMAKVRAAKVRQFASELSLKETDVLAPDDGVITSRQAVLGAVVPAGFELFRMIRQGRLEWRAELTSAELALVKPGMRVKLQGDTNGTVRQVAPSIDPQSRTGLVFVDVQASSLRAGSFARGEFLFGAAQSVLAVPQSSLVARDGFQYVFTVGAVDAKTGIVKAVQHKVTVGGRSTDSKGTVWVAVLSGLKGDSPVVASGAAFLADGDNVRVVKSL